jgi:ribosomal protein L6, bacterial type
MSRIGRKPVEIPKNVKVSLSGRTVTVEGPKGTLSFEHHPKVNVAWDESEKLVTVGIDPSLAEDRQARALWGTTRAILRNMVVGVTEGYKKELEVVGVGWNATLAGKSLNLKVGYANTISMPIPAGITVAVEQQRVTITGPDKQAVGEFAAKVRAKRKPEPYNGKGIKYADEVIQRKQGKQFGS